MHNLTIFSIQKNETPYVSDFVKFHLHLGVDHIVIMDHGSTVPIASQFIGNDKVTVIPFPGYKVHAEAWSYCCTYYRDFTKWGLFIDCDQFFVPANGLSIPEFASMYDHDPKLCAVQVNWHTVGNSGWETKPPMDQLFAFNKRCKDNEGINAHTQSLVKMQNVEGIKWHNPHMAPPKVGFHNIGPEGNLLHHTPFNTPISHSKASIYHLYTRSKEEFIHKQKRGRADILGEHLDMSTYETYNAFCNEVEDNTLKKIWEEIVGPQPMLQAH